ncbi:OsmC family protein [Faunimonas sp. B44]|uniref:OsmC family protein n=1 Tax=Faunimonas sp. B44 TaxID=3461493 RepID=UPI00404505EB
MSAHEYRATIVWRHDGGDFAKGRYSRGHEWRFDGGVTVPASASPSVVHLPLSREDAVDPEEAFVAALSSCHMLTFLDLARRAGLVVRSYEDEAVGTMERIAPGKMAVTRVVLRPKIVFDAEPDAAALADLHHRAHDTCYISNSVKAEVTVEGVPAPAGAH